jgi:hypothetical protein
MIEVKSNIRLSNVVPPEAITAWRKTLKETQSHNCPQEVVDFINAMSEKMDDFSRLREENIKISGYDLQLSGMKEMHGEPINPWELYDLKIPFMIAVDHKKWMHRIFNRQGKQGLINYCRNQVKDTDLERVLSILEVAVFHQERPEFKKVMGEIQASKKIG